MALYNRALQPTVLPPNIVSRLRVQSFAISIDGPNQDLQNPLGVRGPELMEWFFHTRVAQDARL